MGPWKEGGGGDGSLCTERKRGMIICILICAFKTAFERAIYSSTTAFPTCTHLLWVSDGVSSGRIVLSNEQRWGMARLASQPTEIGFGG